MQTPACSRFSQDIGVACPQYGQTYMAVHKITVSSSQQKTAKSIKMFVSEAVKDTFLDVWHQQPEDAAGAGHAVPRNWLRKKE